MVDREELWAAAMRAAKAGDAAAYERLLADMAVVLRRIVRAKLGRLGLDGHDAEDVVQEVLIGLHHKRHSWDGTRPFLPWLNAITHHKLVDAVRRMRRETRGRIDLRPEDWDAAFAAPDVDIDRGLLDVERHLGGLPDAQRAVVRALAVEGQSVRATAVRLSTSEGVVRMMLHRALERISASVEAVCVPLGEKQVP